MLTALRRGSAAVGGQKNPKTGIRTDRTRPLGTKGPQGSLFVVVYALYGVWGVLSDWQSQPAGTVFSFRVVHRRVRVAHLNQFSDKGKNLLARY